MKQKSIAVGVMSLFVLASFTVLLGVSTISTAHKSNGIVASDKDVVHSIAWSTRGNPPSPPVMWTENFFDFYIPTPQNPEGDQTYYIIDWGDGTSSGWIGPYEPGFTASISHVWTEEGTYQIKVKAKDQDGESKCAIYSLTLSSDFKFFHPTLGYVGITYIFTIHYEGYYY